MMDDVDMGGGQDSAGTMGVGAGGGAGATAGAATSAAFGSQAPVTKPATVGGLVLYWGSGSPPAWRVLACLAERGTSYQSQMVTFESKVLKTPCFLKLNPRGMVPILVDGDTVMHESLAILMYLEYRFAAAPLLPKTPQALARTLCHMQEANNVSSAAGEVIYYLRRTAPQDINAEYLFAKREALHKELALWESYLVGSQFLSGPGQPFSLADLAFFPNLAYMVRLGLKLAGRYPNLANYYITLCKRPCFANTWPPHWRTSEGLPMLAEDAGTGAVATQGMLPATSASPGSTPAHTPSSSPVPEEEGSTGL